MSEYRIQVGKARSCTSKLQSGEKEMHYVADSVRGICRSLSIEDASRPVLQARLNRIAEQIDARAASAGMMSASLSEIADLYFQADRNTEKVGDGAEEQPRNGGSGIFEGSFIIDISILTRVIQKLVEEIYDIIRKQYEEVKKIISDATTIDPVEIDNIMFNDDADSHKVYGSNQGAPAGESRARQQELYDIYLRNGGEPKNTTEFQRYLSEMNQHGCGYAALANTMMGYMLETYSGRESEFEREFGYPLMVDGHPNYEAVIVDLYSHGGRAGGTSVSAITARDLAQEYAQAHNIPIHREVTDGVTPQNVDERLRRGEDVTIHYFDGVIHPYDNPAEDHPINAHAMTITGVTEDGKYIVSSWGNKYILDPNEVSTGSNGEETWFTYSVTTFE